MVTLTWIHTRTKLPQVRTYSNPGQAWIQVMLIRTVYPNHPMQLNGADI